MFHNRRTSTCWSPGLWPRRFSRPAEPRTPSWLCVGILRSACPSGPWLPRLQGTVRALENGCGSHSATRDAVGNRVGKGKGPSLLPELGFGLLTPKSSRAVHLGPQELGIFGDRQVVAVWILDPSAGARHPCAAVVHRHLKWGGLLIE